LWHVGGFGPAAPASIHPGIASGPAPAATQNSAPFRVRASGDPRRQPGQVTGAQWGPGHYLGTIAAFKLVSTGAVSEITSSATVWMYVRKVDQALARDLVPAR
jgi:hypothetical protein